MGYRERHELAMQSPRGLEIPIVALYRALDCYRGAHIEAYGSPLGEDMYLGKVWLDMARGFLALLNGDLGRLDGGMLDAAVRRMAVNAGFNEEL